MRVSTSLDAPRARAYTPVCGRRPSGGMLAYDVPPTTPSASNLERLMGILPDGHSALGSIVVSYYQAR